MTKFSEVVYRCPGQHHRKGGTFDWRGVSSEEELEEALKNGWFRSMPEAVDGKHAPREEIVDVSSADDPVDDAPPTREELEVKAKELKLKFTKNTPDDKLFDMINEALEN